MGGREMPDKAGCVGALEKKAVRQVTAGRKDLGGRAQGPTSANPQPWKICVKL